MCFKYKALSLKKVDPSIRKVDSSRVNPKIDRPNPKYADYQAPASNSRGAGARSLLNMD